MPFVKVNFGWGPDYIYTCEDPDVVAGDEVEVLLPNGFQRTLTVQSVVSEAPDIPLKSATRIKP